MRRSALYYRFVLICAVLAICSCAFIAVSNETNPAKSGFFTILDKEAGKTFLSTSDEWSQALSLFDKTSILKRTDNIDLSSYLAYAGAQALDWSVSERERLIRLCDDVVAKVSRLSKLPMPATVFIIKTSGADMASAAYTRRNGIVIPVAFLKYGDEDVEELLIHELFHVISRNAPELRTTLYSFIGFKPAKQLHMPKELADFVITNPDGWENNYAIKVKFGSETYSVMPILYAKSPYNVGKKDSFFNYMVVRLIAIEEKETESVALRINGKYILIDPEKCPSYLVQLGNNTDYIIHPDEVLADNFVFVVEMNYDVPTPELVKKIEQVIR